MTEKSSLYPRLKKILNKDKTVKQNNTLTGKNLNTVEILTATTKKHIDNHPVTLL